MNIENILMELLGKTVRLESYDEGCNFKISLVHFVKLSISQDLPKRAVFECEILEVNDSISKELVGRSCYIHESTITNYERAVNESTAINVTSIADARIGVRVFVPGLPDIGPIRLTIDTEPSLTSLLALKE